MRPARYRSVQQLTGGKAQERLGPAHANGVFVTRALSRRRFVLGAKPSHEVKCLNSPRRRRIVAATQRRLPDR